MASVEAAMLDSKDDGYGDEVLWKSWVAILLLVLALGSFLRRYWQQQRYLNAAWTAKPEQQPLPSMPELRQLREKHFDSLQTTTYQSFSPSPEPSPVETADDKSDVEHTAAATRTPSPPITNNSRKWKAIYTVEELFAWSGPDFLLAAQALNIASSRQHKLVPRVPDSSSPRSIMVCHDMAGNYAEDALVDGWYAATDKSSSSSPQWAWGFRPTHLAWTDAWVYFAHRLVCVPPAGWVASAHKHGCRVYGTLMTEYAQGEDECGKLFASRETAELAADRLNAIRLAHGFDGYLINIENKLEVLPQVGNVLVMLTKLGELGCEVVWYDSVISTTGELRWQNALNELNVCFYLAANRGILTNYGWDEARARASNEFAAATSHHQQQQQVFHGVDVFGRGTLGGGGLHCDVALQALNRAGGSTAVCLFAPGWVLEEECHRDAIRGRDAELVFWDRALRTTGDWGYERPSRYPSPIHASLAECALYTDFCDGGGAKLFANGVMVHSKPWMDLRRQMLQPRWDVLLPSERDDGKAQHRVTVRAIADRAPVFAGNACVQCVGRQQRTTKEKEEWCFFPVLAVHARLGGARGPASVLRVRAAFFCLHGDAALGLTLRGGGEDQAATWLTLTPKSHDGGIPAAHEVLATGVGWVVRTWLIPTYPHYRGKFVTEVSLSPLPVKRNSTTSMNTAWVDVRLGMVSLDETDVDCSQCQPTSLYLHSKTGILTWRCACGSSRCSLMFCNVWYGNEFETCAFANECAIRVDHHRRRSRLPRHHHSSSIFVRGVRWDGSQSPAVELAINDDEEEEEED